MDQRELIRLGLLPDFNYSQPSAFLDEPKRVLRRRLVARPSHWSRSTSRTGSTSGSPRTASPSACSSSDMKYDVLAGLKFRFQTKRKGDNELLPASQPPMGSNGAVEDQCGLHSTVEGQCAPIATRWKSRKRPLEDKDANGDGADAPKAKISRSDVAADTNANIGSRLQFVDFATCYTNGSIAAEGRFNGAVGPEKQTVETSERMEYEVDHGRLSAAPSEDTASQSSKRSSRLGILCGRRLKKRIDETEAASWQTEDDDEEEREAALAAFKAGQEYERMKVTRLLKPAVGATEQAAGQPPVQSAVPAIAGKNIAFAAITTNPNTIPTYLSSGATFQMATTGDSGQTSETAPSSAAPFAPLTAATWSTSSVAPIPNPSPADRTMVESSASVIAPVSTITNTTSSAADVTVTVTLPLQSISAVPSTSLTFRLPVTSASSSTTEPTSGFKFTSAVAPTLNQLTSGINSTSSTATTSLRQPTLGLDQYPSMATASSRPTIAFNSAPAVSSSQPASGFNFTSSTATTATQPPLGFNFMSSSATVSQPTSGLTFSSTATTSLSKPSIGFNFTSAAPSSQASSGFNFTSSAANPSSDQPTSGLNFTFTGQPIGTGQFKFGSADSSTNIFSAVGSTNSVKRKPLAGSTTYLSRRRPR